MLTHRSVLASLAVLLTAGVLPLSAQMTRVEVTRLRAPRAEAADSNERELRKYQRQLDSLARLYNEQNDLTRGDRKRVEDELARTVRRLEDIFARLDADGPQAARAGDPVRIQMAPQVAERASQSMSRALMQVRENEQAMPRGWIGLVVQGPGISPRIEGGEMLVRYFAYPRVVSIDPSSPAQRAGIVPNDTLLAYNGDDVSDGDISLTRLLVPYARVIVRIRRDGKTRDVPVTVAPAPMRIVQRRDDESRARDQWVIASVPKAPGFPRIPAFAPTPGPVRVSVSVRTPMAALAPMPPMPDGASAGAMAVAFSFGAGVAGAQLSTISEGLGRALGVSSGVLVTSAPMGSPASESGLLDGDVILKVGRQSVRRVSEVVDLVRLAAENGDRAVELEIVRQRKPVKLLLRWRN
ncbi:MAG: PDZ domain-containing protein [Gemmatimonadota bacterium]|nr:PDZ domain-containing protein [Gemmatimonadota bacterium]